MVNGIFGKSIRWSLPSGDKNLYQNCLSARYLCWRLISNPRNTRVCLRFETTRRRDLGL